MRRVTSTTCVVPPPPEHHHDLTGLLPAGEHATAPQPTEEGVGLEEADQHAERPVPVRSRRGDMREHLLDQRGHVGPGDGRAVRGPARERLCAVGAKIQLCLGRPQGIEQAEDGFVRNLGPGVCTIHLADRND